MIFEIIITVVMLAAIALVRIDISVDIENLERELKVLKQDINYKLELPHIAEFAKIRGFDGYFQMSDGLVRFYNTEEGCDIPVYQIEKRLEEAKKAIELACPKKCAKKK